MSKKRRPVAKQNLISQPLSNVKNCSSLQEATGFKVIHDDELLTIHITVNRMSLAVIANIARYFCIEMTIHETEDGTDTGTRHISE